MTYIVFLSPTFTFTFMHLADAFIQSDLQCIQAIHVFMCIPWESNPQPFALLTQCSTTEPQEHPDTPTVKVNVDQQMFGYPDSSKYLLLCSAQEIN